MKQKMGMILICSDELDLRAVYYVQETFFSFASFWGPRYMDLSWPFTLFHLLFVFELEELMSKVLPKPLE